MFKKGDIVVEKLTGKKARVEWVKSDQMMFVQPEDGKGGFVNYSIPAIVDKYKPGPDW